MESTKRNSGVTAVGEIPWGAHFCQFYRSQDDLADVLVPFFEAGLRDNESCLWVTSEPLEADKAESLMVDAMPEFKKYISRGQMQIFSMSDWYKPGDAFDADKVLQGWVDKEAESRSSGYAGLRLTGNTTWLDRSGWDDFMHYERKVNQTFGKYRLVALCTYCLDKCTAEDVMDVCTHHEFALARRQGDWQLLESSSLKMAKSDLARANAELELRVAERTAALNAAIAGRDEFLAMLGHELRNPLAPIRNATDVIRTLVSPDSRLGESAAVLDRQVSHITRLVNDLLDVSRITQGQILLNKKVVSVVTVIEQAVELSRPIIDKRGHSLSVALPSRHVKVSGDMTRLAQVCGNLLHNAAKYTPDGGQVSIAATVKQDDVVITVKDTGPGIPDAMLKSIFGLFTQLPRSIDRSDGGLGIGLTLVQRITEMHGGHIEVANDTAAGGAVFSVHVPLASEAVAPVETPRKALRSLASATSRRILIIDDNRDANFTTSSLLEMGGHEVMSAFDGISGLALSKSFQPSVILLDLGLPGIDGYEVARRLRNDPGTAQTFIVAVTGYGLETDIAQTRDAGFNAHVVKPASIEQLLSLIAQVPAAPTVTSH